MTGPFNPAGAQLAIPTSISHAIQRINDELNRRPSRPMTLSSGARQKLGLVQTEYLADIAQEAIRIARRGRLVTVDESHIDEAVERFASGKTGHNAATNAANTFGGLLAGAGIAMILAILFTPGKHGNLEIVTAFALSVIGFSLIMVGLFRHP
jgi:histone H3/H4